MTERTYWHRYNFLKFRIMIVLVHSDKPLTSKEIAIKLGVSTNNVSCFFARCKAYKYGYFKCLKKKDKTGQKWSYRYQMNKRGLKAYALYSERYMAGRRLNLRNDLDFRKIQDNSYIGISRKGQEEGLTLEQAGRKLKMKPQFYVYGYNP
jgi:hypothetical protein